MTISLAPSQLDDCENEPIHIPGVIQPFGILVALDAKLKIIHLSENVERILNRKVDSLLGESIMSLVRFNNSSDLDCLSYGGEIQTDIRTSLDLKKSDGSFETYDVSIHSNQSKLILEFEAKPKKSLPKGLGFIKELEKSILQIQKSRTFKNLCDATTREIIKLTNFHRVMIYRFDPEWNGVVISESRSGQGVDSYLDHHFPSADIPAQARAVFLRNWVRMIPDVNYLSDKIVPTLGPVKQTPLDLGRSLLRGVSPLHIEYLKNMGVGATITISLIKDDRLWGLIACHNLTPLWLDGDVRAGCEFIGKLVSSQLRLREENDTDLYRQRLRVVQASFIESIRSEENISLGLLNQGPSLLGLTGASGAAIYFEDEWTLVGKTPSLLQLEDLSAWLVAQTGEFDEGVFCSSHLSDLFPGAKRYVDVASGMLAISLPKAVRSYIMWFRPEVIETVTWAGNPGILLRHLTPRTSFESWKQTVVHTSKNWHESEIDAALELKHSVISFDLQCKFRLEQKARATAERITLEKEILLNTVSHDLKTPLTIIDLALQLFLRQYPNEESTQGDRKKIFGDFRRVIKRVSDASRRMQGLIHALLDMAQIDGGKFPLTMKLGDIQVIIAETIDTMKQIAQEKEISLTFQPYLGRCERMIDADRLIQVTTNLVGNAIKFAPVKGRVSMSVKIKDNNFVISVIDNGPGIISENLPHVFDRFWQAKATGRTGSGLGLAICKGIIEAHGGKIWIESEPGYGTVVSFTLPYYPDAK